MPTQRSIFGVYPKDDYYIPTVVCIGARRQTDQNEGISNDGFINRQLGCATHTITPMVAIDQDNIIWSSSTLSEQLELTKQLQIDSIKVGLLGNVTQVEEVYGFLKYASHPMCPIVMDLTMNEWDDETLQQINDLILPIATVLILSYSNASKIGASNLESLEDSARFLLQLGPKVIIIQDNTGRQFAAIKENDELIEMQHLGLLSDGNGSNWETLSTVVTASLAQNRQPLDLVLAYERLFSRRDDEQVHRSCVLTPPFTFTQELWSSVTGIYSSIQKLPFLNKMLDDSLNESIYDYYIIQDYQFFLQRETMLESLANNCPHEEAQQFFYSQLEKNKKWTQTVLSDNNLSPLDERTSFKMPACQKYVNSMQRLASSSHSTNWIKGLVALLPCSLIYHKVGDWMISSGTQPTIKRYADFIDYYRDPARRNRLISFIDLIEAVVNECSDEERQELKQLFRCVCEYEYAFWDESYRYGLERLNLLLSEK